MPGKNSKVIKWVRRIFDQDFKSQAVPMMLDGYSATSVAENVSIRNTDLLHRWRSELMAQGGTVARGVAMIMVYYDLLTSTEIAYLEIELLQRGRRSPIRLLL